MWHSCYKSRPYRPSCMHYPDSKVHGANMGPTWVLSAPDGPHVGPMNLAFRVGIIHDNINEKLSNEIHCYDWGSLPKPFLDCNLISVGHSHWYYLYLYGAIRLYLLSELFVPVNLCIPTWFEALWHTIRLFGLDPTIVRWGYRWSVRNILCLNGQLFRKKFYS